MDILISPRKLHGNIRAIPSKSQAHRVLICSAFSDRPTTIVCPSTSQDIEATVACLRQLGAVILQTADGYFVEPIIDPPKTVQLYCRESGTTLRFLLPIIGALGIDATFHLEGRLPYRPILPLWEIMQSHGCYLSKPFDDAIRCHGKLLPGKFVIPGNISSQFISGLLFACSLMDGNSEIRVTGEMQSSSYVQMTQSVLKSFGSNCDEMMICGTKRFITPGNWVVEGDWSNSAFFLAANSLGSSVKVENLNVNSIQGDRKILEILSLLNTYCTIDAADTPDLIPILCLVVCCKNGAVFTNTDRLRFKESDRVDAILALLAALGCSAESHDNKIIINPGIIRGGTVDSFHDHRIAMTAAIAATIATEPLKIKNAHCVQKSYPSFWDDYRMLGGNYEQILW